MLTPWTALVDDRLPAIGAVATATALHRRLVSLAAIDRSPGLWSQDGGSSLLRAALFTVRGDDASLLVAPGIVAIGIHVRAHRWIADVHDGAHLVEGGGEMGLFAADDVDLACPECGHLVVMGGEESAYLEEALSVWTEGSETAPLVCPACGGWTPLPHWHSPGNGFACGELAVTLWGAHLRELIDPAPDTPARLLRTALGDAQGRFAVVFGRG
ncbi:MAG TPA: hypothetical protein VK519_06960 [Pinirhizobacter sp.]|uniref:hypothetical protein n=1 Tax=Pinirhizobacter sp. TaxID=2950432 RepID=UPI002CD79891|nr:hypothetical protein [Pinirhizobacter sp.]HMH67641.1 hypothetical protein [Pinirhizobacter sp.]